MPFKTRSMGPKWGGADPFHSIVNPLKLIKAISSETGYKVKTRLLHLQTRGWITVKTSVNTPPHEMKLAACDVIVTGSSITIRGTAVFRQRDAIDRLPRLERDGLQESVKLLAEILCMPGLISKKAELSPSVDDVEAIAVKVGNSSVLEEACPFLIELGAA